MWRRGPRVDRTEAQEELMLDANITQGCTVLAGKEPPPLNLNPMLVFSFLGDLEKMHEDGEKN